jgi:hypothetical protein
MPDSDLGFGVGGRVEKSRLCDGFVRTLDYLNATCRTYSTPDGIWLSLLSVEMAGCR